MNLSSTAAMLSRLSPARILKQLNGEFIDQEFWPEGLRINAGILSPAELDTVQSLLSLHQDHVFDGWDAVGVNDEAKHGMLAQAARLLANGLVDYVKRSKVLLLVSQKGENPFKGWAPSVPSGVAIDPSKVDEFEELESFGRGQIGRCGFVLVAGGLGERLGYSGIKIALPSETLTGTSYIELYCQQIKAIQDRYGGKFKLPFAIMTSDDTHSRTESLLRESAYFGLEASQVTLMKQEKVAALLDNEAHMALLSPYELDSKPHGHGDVHLLMHSTHTAASWAKQGVKWVAFFQDTNGLAFLPLCAALGVSAKLDLEVNSMAVPRKAKQAVGAVTRLVNESGREMTVNVEYNQLDPLLRATVSPEGDVNDPATGFSPYPGNINQLVFKLEPYLKTLRSTGGIMGEFVNPKYADSDKSRFKKPTRLECMMQDYPKVLPAGARVGFTSAPSWVCYSPCKNNSADAAASIAAGVPAGSPITAESDQYCAFAQLLRTLGAKVDAGPADTFLGIAAPLSPQIVFHPSFAIFFSEIAARVPYPAKVSISRRSSLVVKGNVIIESLSLDGALKLSAPAGSTLIVRAGGHRIVNAGYKTKACGKDAPEATAMRGYVLDKVAEEVVEAPGEGSYVFTGRAIISESAYDYETEAANDSQSCLSCW